MVVAGTEQRPQSADMKKFSFHPLRLTILSFCISAFLIADSPGVLMVDWGGNYVSATEV
jgi:hypothetical protein